jgi:hypothetical protein
LVLSFDLVIALILGESLAFRADYDRRGFSVQVLFLIFHYYFFDLLIVCYWHVVLNEESFVESPYFIRRQAVLFKLIRFIVFIVCLTIILFVCLGFLWEFLRGYTGC